MGGMKFDKGSENINTAYRSEHQFGSQNISLR
jgi:hypothetical protein